MSFRPPASQSPTRREDRHSGPARHDPLARGLPREVPDVAITSFGDHNQEQ
jgi:hypothetical protein